MANSSFTPQQIEEFLQEFFDVVGTRQYIGARYVPIFGRPGESSIEWNNSAPYEPLTIVTYQGNTYTSRTYVPTGVDISNQSYWALTGPYNAQIAAYIEQFNALSQQMAQYRTDINEDFDDFKDEQQDNYDTFVANVDRMSCMRPNCVLIGDSWTSDTTTTIVDGVNWRQYLKGWTFHNYAIGGAGFLVGVTYDEQVDRAIADTSYNHDTITDVIIMGGLNDWNRSQNGADYISPIQQVLNKVAVNFRFARIHLWFASTTKPNSVNSSHWNDSYQLWALLCRWVNLTYAAGSVSAVNYAQVDARILTPLFPMSAFITTGDPNWTGHLSTQGHRVLSRIVASLIYTGNLPEGVFRTKKALPLYDDNNVQVGHITYMNGVRTQHGYKFIGEYVADTTAEGQTIGYLDLSTEALNDEYFVLAPRSGVFNFCPLDLFPLPNDSTVNASTFTKWCDERTLTETGFRFGSVNSNPINMYVGFVSYYANYPLRLRVTTRNQVASTIYPFKREIDYRFAHGADISLDNDVNDGIGYLGFE